ncbi:30S ribosomal protein S11 [Candidatus Berkelbacteria bacterium CG10_big_fil_rev_8_21_14_0_10_41_12]|uniref:Small ribosomal subunit protein uS11 n=1 Tax=Candidatus Berkelbacteria bacterium CG10_big_fil_rev_8_21_14_0_10_41_12 TaxID=1974513 RepID=A0A2M6WXU7_9BACT|nr:MAG: 30S ribosomal protein S11 [Candidatus Berkelbacteria bacterium CG10_big_fil_rev_8_21_14_0_10_41_12]
MAKKIIAKKKKVTRVVEAGILNVKSTFNNTIVTLSDTSGNVINWSSAGSLGFKGSKKSTPYAAGQAMKAVLEKSKPVGLKEVVVNVSGVGAGRESAVRAIIGSGLKISRINDVTPIPHNGCRAKKPRRI